VAEKYLQKGAKVFLEGQLQTRKWTDQSGQEKYTTEVVLQRFRGQLVMLDSRGGQGQGAGGGGGGYDAAPSYDQQPAMAAAGGGGMGGGDDLDDEIPF